MEIIVAAGRGLDERRTVDSQHVGNRLGSTSRPSSRRPRSADPADVSVALQMVLQLERVNYQAGKEIR